jgi:F-type H+-transporting ATPase subunit alpha
MAILNKGARNVEILKQAQYAPVPVEKQIAIIYCGTMGLLKDVPVDNVKAFENEYLEILDLQHRDILDKLKEGLLNDEITDLLEKVASEVMIKYIPQ